MKKEKEGGGNKTVYSYDIDLSYPTTFGAWVAMNILVKESDTMQRKKRLAIITVRLYFSFECVVIYVTIGLRFTRIQK